MKKLNIAFFGAPSFAARVLQRIIDDKNLPITVVLVVTQPDRPAGRKQISTSTPVKLLAQKNNIPVFDDSSLTTNDQRLQDVDIALLYAYGAIIPSDILKIPRWGFWNIHPSLLPKYRGASPIAYSLLMGDKTTGVSLIQMDERMDHGPILSQQTYEIQKEDTREDLENKLSDIGYELFKQSVQLLINGTLQKVEQNNSNRTFTRLLTKQDGYIPFPIVQKIIKRVILKNKEIIDWIPASAGMTQNTTNHYPPFDFAQGKPTTSHQYLYGIIQGGTYEDLRKKSAEFVVGKNTPGVAIGGVSVGETKEEMRKQVEWVAPYLPKDRPVHLLGVGQVDDIVDLVEFGIDTFDCVEPTRLARVGRVYETKKILEYVETRHGTSLQAHTFDFDINKLSNKSDLTPLDENCHCSTCMNYSKAYLYHLFKQRELLGYTLLSYHNLFVMECLMEQVRIMIEANKL